MEYSSYRQVLKEALFREVQTVHSHISTLIGLAMRNCTFSAFETYQFRGVRSSGYA